MGHSRYELILRAALDAACLGREQPIAAFVDTVAVKRTIRELHEAFPGHFEHAFAAKANTMSDALKLVKNAGMSCEVASPGELEQALRAGFSACVPGSVRNKSSTTNRSRRRLFYTGCSLWVSA
jgi:diaminopimelate decarboxylase